MSLYIYILIFIYGRSLGGLQNTHAIWPNFLGVQCWQRWSCSWWESDDNDDNVDNDGDDADDSDGDDVDDDVDDDEKALGD